MCYSPVCVHSTYAQAPVQFLKPSNAELFPSAFTLAQLLCMISTVVGSSAPWGKYDIFISNVLPHGKYDMEYNSCLLPRKQGSVVSIQI